MGTQVGIRSAVVAVACAALLVGCDGGGGGSAPPTTEDDALATALGYLPADVSTVQFGDATSWLKDHGFADETPTKLLADKRFAKESQQASYAESGLWNYLRVMDGWGWTAADIAWSATTTKGSSGPLVHYVRFRDDTDLDVVKKSLRTHGYRAHGQTLVGPSLAGIKDAVAASLVLNIGHTVRIYPDKHLMVGSSAGLPGLPADSKSLGGRAGVRSVVAPVRTANYVSITAGPEACIMPRNSVPAQLKQLHGLGQITTSAAAVVSDTKSIATVAYSSSDAASKDLPHRKSLVKGTSLLRNQPYDQIAHFALTRQGSTIHYTIGAKPRVVPQMVRSRDAPWAMCGHPSSTSASPTSS